MDSDVSVIPSQSHSKVGLAASSLIPVSLCLRERSLVAP
jgi:hypothetical protein